MLSKEKNEKLVRVGEGTPMGNLFRRFWVPVLVSNELPEPDCSPVRVKVFGEELIAFKDTEGKIGLVDRWCPHRGAELFFGRNEECGLRCVYHGWKFDTDGNCVDLPNTVDGDRIKEKIKIKSYPVRDVGGMIWAYLGPVDKMPEVPQLEYMSLPSEHIAVQRTWLEANYAQQMEGNIDASHVSFAHTMFGDGITSLFGSDTDMELPVDKYAFEDKAPRYDLIKDTDFGFMLGAVRDAEPGFNNIRISHFMLPSTVLVASPPGRMIAHHITIPADDEHVNYFLMVYNPSRPFAEKELDLMWKSGFFFQEKEVGSNRPAANRDNDYQIDREAQKNWSFTGILSGRTQDNALQEVVFGSHIMDRSREKLMASDKAIVHARNRLLKLAEDLEEGIEPAEAQQASAFNIRPLDFVYESSMDIEKAAEPYMYGELPWAKIVRQ